MLRRGVHLLEARSHLLIVAQAALGDGRHAHDAVQRRADLVGHARKELAFRPAGLARLGKRLLGPVAFLGEQPLVLARQTIERKEDGADDGREHRDGHEAARRRILRHDASPGRLAAALPSAGVGTHGNGAGRRVLLPEGRARAA